jgi:hypothetical protein
MIGDTSDFLARIKSVIPPNWFPTTQSGRATQSPVLDGVLTGIASCLSTSFALLKYVILQTRINTATGVFLDMISGDFFGSFLARRVNEGDGPFLIRIKKELFRKKVTRPAMIQALTDLTGSAPIVFEPRQTLDTGGYGVGGTMGYGIDGGYGSLTMPYQYFITALRASGGYLSSVAGYGGIGAITGGAKVLNAPGGYPGGYGNYAMTAGGGAIENATLAYATGPVADSDILKVINDVKPAGTIAWTMIETVYTPPSAPASVAGLVSAPPNDGTTGHISLSWTASTGATSYMVLYRQTGTSSWLIASNSVSGTSLIITGLTGGTSYDFVVLAMNSAGPSSLCAAVSAVPYLYGMALDNPPVATSITHNTSSPPSPWTSITVSPTPSGKTIQAGWSTSNATPPSVWVTSSTTYASYTAVWYLTLNSAVNNPGNAYVWVRVLDAGNNVLGQIISGPYTIT